MISYWVLIAFDWKCLLFWNGPDFFLIGNNYSIIGKILRFIGNEVLDLNMCCQLNSTDSLDFHVNSVMIIANGWTQIASWVPNPLNSLTLIRNDVIFFSQCKAWYRKVIMQAKIFEIRREADPIVAQKF